jgi:hypothetical protein
MENGNFRVFAASGNRNGNFCLFAANENGKRKLVFLDRQIINGKQRLLF